MAEKKKNKKQARDIRALSYQILQLANRGLLRIDFQREVSKMLIDFSGCDSIELWLRDHEKYYRCKASQQPNRSFKIKFMPSVQHKAGRKLHLRRLHTDKDDGSLALFPLVVDSQTIGLLRLKSKHQSYFTQDEIGLYEGLGQTLAIAVAHRHVQVDLRERVKELTCLYGIARLVAQPGISLEEVLQGIVELLPPAWLYPEIASSRIILDGHFYSTPDFQESPYRQAADIVVNEERRGSVEVVYREERSDLDEGPFLKEERSLIDTVSKEVSTIIKRRQAEEEKARLEEQLRHADRLATIGQLAAGMAHELNEPLGNILGFAQLAQKCPGLPYQAEQDIEKILTASLYAREVVKNLLIFARQMPTQKKQVDLNQVVEESLYFFASRCAKEGIELARSLSPDLPKIPADPAQLKQVFINLIVNALQAMPEGGRLKVQTSVQRGRVSFSVEDTGTGMSEELLKKIFTPFFTTKEIGQGTGLGLPVVHGIITSHGGSIKVESKLGRGTKFEIELPVKEPKKMEEKNENTASR